MGERQKIIKIFKKEVKYFYASEVANDTKGGYLEGAINLPVQFLNDEVISLRLLTFPPEDDGMEKAIQAKVHSPILHTVR